MTTLPPSPDPGLLGLIDQSPTLATIVGGLIVAGILYGLSFVPRLKLAYKVVGLGAERILGWILGLRVNGTVKRDLLVQAGYDDKSRGEGGTGPFPTAVLAH